MSLKNILITIGSALLCSIIVLCYIILVIVELLFLPSIFFILSIIDGGGISKLLFLLTLVYAVYFKLNHAIEDLKNSFLSLKIIFKETILNIKLFLKHNKYK